MQADWAVELGDDDDVLEFPWASEDGRLRYLDLKTDPELLFQVEETLDCDPLREFLAAINSAHSALLTAKCDTWTTDELSEEEAYFQAAIKFGSYVDVLFAEDGARFSFEEHESLAKRAAELLGRAPEISAAAEFIVRRCYYRVRVGGNGHEPQPRAGYYLTVYVFGYGDDEDDARARWGVGLNLAQNALLQLTSRR